MWGVHGKRGISWLSWERTSASDTDSPALLKNKITTISRGKHHILFDGTDRDNKKEIEHVLC